jgi:hypothetical protein
MSSLGPHNTQRGRRGFIARGSSALMLHVVRPGGARLHDFWQQARIRVQTSVNGGQCSARRGRRGHSYFLVLDGLASARGGQKPGRPCLGAPLRACLSRIVRYRMAPRSQGLFAVVSTGKKGKNNSPAHCRSLDQERKAISLHSARHRLDEREAGERTIMPADRARLSSRLLAGGDTSFLGERS